MNIRQDKQALGYRLDVTPLPGPTVARRGDTIVAESANARIMHETRLPPVVYFPRRDIKATLLRSTGFRTFCPFKGTATYFDVEIEGEVHENGAWTYMNALPESAGIEGLVAFMPQVLTGVDFAEVDTEEQTHGNISGPTIDWIMREAWLCDTPEALTQAIAEKFNEDGHRSTIDRKASFVHSL